MTILQVIEDYLTIIRQSRSFRTADTYKNGLMFFLRVIGEHHINPDDEITALTEDCVSWLASALKDYSAATEQLYLTAVSGFYAYLAAEQLVPVNLPRLKLLIHQRQRRLRQRLPQFPADAIDHIVIHLINTANAPIEIADKLIYYRDRALLITLADTGLRIHEACSLKRGDMDWNEGKAIVIGKGDREEIIRFSARALRALRDYLSLRSEIDGASGTPLARLPLFARHDKGTGKKVKAITTTTGRNIVQDRVAQIIGPDAVGTITPHSFRHYFVTRVLRSSGNLKLAQSLARHKNIAVTQRYAHMTDDELDRGYFQAIEPEKSDIDPENS